jgi:hypothetical protein
MIEGVSLVQVASQERRSLGRGISGKTSDDRLAVHYIVA